ncbi:YppE family protein [Lysinibacillus sp. 54212]|uniref:YppE family protein n=1 Tax=Lysinibacillus sp. 54212 TaxID=3119829 RepID=UPI002FC6FF10
MQLLQYTNRLLLACDEASSRFFDMRERDAVPDFYNQVKPYADDMRELLLEWQGLAHHWISAHQPKYMHKQQIDHAVDGMEQFFVQSFYKETSKKRFLQSIEAAKYTLTTLERYLQEGETDAK